ncbi:hypothetical protein BGZ83_004493, partial [Gryganskiella cystojenkinii]
MFKKSKRNIERRKQHAKRLKWKDSKSPVDKPRYVVRKVIPSRNPLVAATRSTIRSGAPSFAQEVPEEDNEGEDDRGQQNNPKPKQNQQQSTPVQGRKKKARKGKGKGKPQQVRGIRSEKVDAVKQGSKKAS